MEKAAFNHAHNVVRSKRRGLRVPHKYGTPHLETIEATDAYGAKSFGYTTYRVNRFNLPAEELGTGADRTSNNLDGLLDFVLGHH